MIYNDNCPASGEFDPERPIQHNDPVHHSFMRVEDYPDKCLWDQLRWERKRNDGGPAYLENLEGEWQHRNLCSRCLRELDHPFMTEVDSLRQRAETAESKIAGINDAARLPDAAFRLAVLEILERDLQDEDEDGE